MPTKTIGYGQEKTDLRNGKPIADNQNIQTADVRGPAMLQDVWYLENSPISTGK